MKKLLLFWLLVLGGLKSYAQHDLYNWHVKAYAGLGHYFNPDLKTIDYLQPDENFWYRLEIGHSLGKSFGLSANASMGKIRGLAPLGGYFTADSRMTALRLYFYTDNGWLLKENALVAPYVFGGYGLSTLKDAPTNDKYQQALPFGLGFKFRIADRWQLDLQTEAVYHTTASANDIIARQNKYNNSFLYTGVALAYNFGFKPSSFKAARFYSSFQQPLPPETATTARSVLTNSTITPLAPLPIDSVAPTTGVNQIVDTTISKLQTRTTTLDSPDFRSAVPRLVVIRDTVKVRDNSYGAIPDTSSTTTFRRQIQDSITNVNQKRLAAQTKARSHDSVLTAAQRKVVADRAKALNDRDRALAEYDQRTRRANALRQAELDRSRESLNRTSAYRTNPRPAPVYQTPSPVYNNSRTPVVPVNPSATVLLDNDRKDLDEVNRKNLQLRYAYDSLNALRSRDTAQNAQVRRQNSVAYNNLNSQLMRYMQDQATLNDSLRQRLNLYENQLRRSPKLVAPVPATNNVTTSGSDLPGREIKFDSTIFFNKNSNQILPLNFNNLLGCATYLKANPNQKIQLTGYADKSGKPEYNLILSRRRVEAVSEFLQYRGIDKERILMQYFGEENSTDPVVTLDRKVILRILN
ncbi:OmpA family protein [Adhaeribacter swui]|uniref:OmpA family protein n=1 Tax=Adhaeribacter swui TaxID=2086471 RepID=A0A7G7G4F5_9BACT|nr:OmpA family protein [Adhaeribacter swui]QNF32039.1 OmpA family protein [Adhaeribacter swui]